MTSMTIEQKRKGERFQQPPAFIENFPELATYFESRAFNRVRTTSPQFAFAFFLP